MKNLFLLVIINYLLVINLFSQAQQKTWYLEHKSIDFTSGPTVSQGLPGWTSGAPVFHVNGVYDSNNDLLFYVKDFSIINKYGSQIGSIIPPLSFLSTNEVAIIPVPGSSCKFFVVASSHAHNPEHISNLFYSTIDMTLNNLEGGMVGPGSVLIPVPNGGVGLIDPGLLIAVGKLNPSTNERFVYAVGSPSFLTSINNIFKYRVSASGITFVNSFFIFNPYYGSKEAELSPDGTRLAFATASNIVTIVELDPNGDYNSDQNFILPSTPGKEIIGLEFSPNSNNLFASVQTDGNFHIDVGASIVQGAFLGSGAYGQSQLELAFDAKIYASNGSDLGGILNPDGPIILSTGFLPIAIPGITLSINTSFSPAAYILPDQIDGENYDDRFVGMDAVCCAASVNYHTLAGTLPYVVSSNSTWSPFSNPFGNANPIYVKGQIVIPPSVTLTLDAGQRMEFAPDAKITIRAGGKLIVNGATLTSIPNCSSVWEGIEVLGNRSQSQFVIGAQGQLITMNNALIENAHEAITTIGLDVNGNWDWNSTGGIVKCENTTFLNCRRGTQFLSYRNFNPNNPATTLNNLSFFKQCNFVTTSAFNYGVFTGPFAGISILDVSGVRVLGCSFTNNDLNQIVPNLKGRGIVSLDARYSIDDAGTAISQFNNLWYGIHASASNPLNSVGVYNTDFANNINGVFLNGINYSIFVGNNFTVSPSYLNAYGLYLNSCSYYQVENNQFSSLTNALANVGLYINNSGKPANLIYNNVFTDLTAGSIAQNVNDGPSPNDGLRINCNDYIGNDYHIAVLGSLGGSKIGLVQGVCANYPGTAVRNTYSAPCSTIENQYFVNENTVFQQIYHASFSETYTDPQCKDPLVVSSICNANFIKPTECPNTFNCNPPCQRLAILDIENTISDLQATLDAGNAQSLFDAINGSMENGDLKNLLTAASPYLSDAVLIAYLQRHNAPPGHIKDIIIANSPVSAEVMAIISAMNLPNGIRNQIVAMQVGISERTYQEQRIALKQADKELAIDQIIRYFLNDTSLVGGLDSAKIFLSGLNRQDALCQTAGVHLINGNVTDAQAIIDAHIAEFGEADRLCSFLNLLIELNENIEGCLSLHTDTLLAGQIGLVAVDEDNKMCVNAQSLQAFVLNFDYPEETLLPDAENNLRNGGNDNRVWSESKDVKCYPNPAKNDLMIELLTDLNNNAKIQMINALGIVVSEIKISTAITKIDLSPIARGIYFLKIVNGEIINVEKIIIQ